VNLCRRYVACSYSRATGQKVTQPGAPLQCRADRVEANVRQLVHHKALQCWCKLAAHAQLKTKPRSPACARVCVRVCVQVPETRGPACVRACPVCASAGAGSHHPMVCMAASLSRWQPPIPSSAVILWHAVTAKPRKRSCGLTHGRPWNHLRCDRPRTHARAREHNRTQRMHAHKTHTPHMRARAHTYTTTHPPTCIQHAWIPNAPASLQ
jgi:hypothetical protein